MAQSKKTVIENIINSYEGDARIWANKVLSPDKTYPENIEDSIDFLVFKAANLKYLRGMWTRLFHACGGQGQSDWENREWAKEGIKLIKGYISNLEGEVDELNGTVERLGLALLQEQAYRISDFKSFAAWAEYNIPNADEITIGNLETYYPEFKTHLGNLVEDRAYQKFRAETHEEEIHRLTSQVERETPEEKPAGFFGRVADKVKGYVSDTAEYFFRVKHNEKALENMLEDLENVVDINDKLQAENDELREKIGKYRNIENILEMEEVKQELPDSYKSFIDAAEEKMDQGRYGLAFGNLNQAKAVAETSEVLVKMGYALEMMNGDNADLAMKSYESAIDLAREEGNLHNESVALFNMGKLYLKKGDLVRAKQCVESANEAEPRPKAYEVLGAIKFKN
jgi:tetratricopeptide (TPR) repeat protein